MKPLTSIGTVSYASPVVKKQNIVRNPGKGTTEKKALTRRGAKGRTSRGTTRQGSSYRLLVASVSGGRWRERDSERRDAPGE